MVPCSLELSLCLLWPRNYKRSLVLCRPLRIQQKKNLEDKDKIAVWRSKKISTAEAKNLGTGTKPFFHRMEKNEQKDYYWYIWRNKWKQCSKWKQSIELIIAFDQIWTWKQWSKNTIKAGIEKVYSLHWAFGKRTSFTWCSISCHQCHHYDFEAIYDYLRKRKTDESLESKKKDINNWKNQKIAYYQKQTQSLFVEACWWWNEKGWKSDLRVILSIFGQGWGNFFQTFKWSTRSLSLIPSNQVQFGCIDWSQEKTKTRVSWPNQNLLL